MFKEIQKIFLMLGAVLIVIILFPIALIFLLLSLLFGKRVEGYKFDQQILDALVPVIEEFPSEDQGEIDHFVDKFAAAFATLSHEQRDLVKNIISYLNNISRFSVQELFEMVQLRTDFDDAVKRLGLKVSWSGLLTTDFHDTVLNNIRDYRGNILLLTPYTHALYEYKEVPLAQAWYELLVDDVDENCLFGIMIEGPDDGDLAPWERERIIESAQHFKVMHAITRRLKEVL